MVVLYGTRGTVTLENRQPNVKDITPSIACCGPFARGAHVRTLHRPGELL